MKHIQESIRKTRGTLRNIGKIISCHGDDVILYPDRIFIIFPKNFMDGESISYNLRNSDVKDIKMIGLKDGSYVFVGTGTSFTNFHVVSVEEVDCVVTMFKDNITIDKAIQWIKTHMPDFYSGMDKYSDKFSQYISDYIKI